MKSFKKPSILLLFLFILLNGHNPVLRLFYIFPSSLSYIIWIIIFIVINRKISLKIQKTVFTSLFFIILYVMLSLSVFDNQNLGRIIQLIANITLSLLVINYYKHTLFYNIKIILKFICYYSLIMWGLIIFSKIFLSLDIFSLTPSFFLFPDNEVIDLNNHALFFNFRGYNNLGHFSLFRNPGFFWEPGALSGTVIMLYLMLFKNKAIRKDFDNTFYLVCFTVFSTFSILGIATIAIIFLFKLFKKEKERKWISVNGVIAAILIVFSSQFFIEDDSGLKKKFDFQLDKVGEEKKGWESNRLGTAIFIQDVIESDDLKFGVGLFTGFNDIMGKLRRSGYESDHAIGNGFFLMYLQLGIYLYSIILIFLFFKLKKYYNETITAVFVFIILLIQLQGEVWNNYNLIYLFLFLHLSIFDEKINSVPKLGVFKQNNNNNTKKQLL